VFGPTRRPNEPITEGAPFGPGDPGPLAQDEQMTTDRMLQVIYAIRPHPTILRLMSQPR
jgi:hypothetical protein